MKRKSARMKRQGKPKLLNSEDAKIFLADAGDELKSPGMALIENDCAALKQILDTSDLAAKLRAVQKAPLVLMKAGLRGEISMKERAKAMAIIEQAAKTLKRGKP
jgi:hypothetical protein